MRSESGKNPKLRFAPIPQYVESKLGSLEITSKYKLLSNLPEEFSFILTQFISEISHKCLIEGENKILSLSEIDKIQPEEILQQAQSLLNSDEKIKQKFSEQGYIIDVLTPMQTVCVWADNPQGVFYGIQTLYQISNSFCVPGRFLFPNCKIIDYPDMTLRGISDDVSRGQMATVEGFKEFIVQLSRFKMNHYFIYIEDVFKFSSHPKIGENSGALTADDIKELSSFAKQYFITLSPIFESLGHMDNILSLPEYVKYAEFPGSDCLNVSEPNIYPFLGELYRDLADAFESSHFHIGCDESWELGKFKSKDFVKKKGKGQVYLNHYKKLYEIAQKHGKKNIYLYHDIASKFVEVLEAIPKDYVFVYWDYSTGGKKSRFPKINKIIDAGFKVIVSPAVQDWSLLFPNMRKMEENTVNLIKYGFNNGSHGVIQSSWGDFRNENFRDNRIYGFAFSSAMAWNIEDFSSKSFWDAFILNFFENDIRITPLVKTTLDYFAKCFIKLGKRDYYTLLWAHPFATKLCEFDTKGFFELITELESILDDFKNFHDYEGKNTHYLHILEYNLELYLFFMKKLIVSNISKSLDQYVFNNMPVEQIKYYFNQLDELRDNIMDLKEKYHDLWTVYHSEANLDKLLIQYDWLKQFYAEKSIQIRNREFFVDPNIPSEWIFHINHRKKGMAMRTFFQKKIELPEDIKYFYLQTIGDTHIKIYLNGEFIDEFFSKRTLSVKMLNQMIHICDLTDKVKPGPNLLTIENINYKAGFGIVNIYGEVKLKEIKEKMIIKSDKSWTVSHEFNERWLKEGGNIVKNRIPKSLGTPPLINGSLSYPKFKEGLASHHTKYLGFTNCEILLYTPRYLAWLLKYLSKMALKRGLLI